MYKLKAVAIQQSWLIITKEQRQEIQEQWQEIQILQDKL